ncbi:DUF6572 domain-containing protein [Caballeronia sp. LZ016]|uniref:DUF6572 domain-containing protein n=1 Tax=Caballeronia sp. LZ016 TaxID=3038554 RepID=UPI002864C4F2|nr:DUF6572 domain-containing protein [Caballeronia sp. LZ016]MDR5739857.1 hypothetical protein [Caballeronia sp. LZ016]
MTMSLRDVDVIDYIGINVLFKQVYVGLFDDLDWQDEQLHQDLLTKKIDHYTRYIRSGQLLLNYPKVRGYEIVVEYVSMQAMTPSGVRFWKTREELIRAAGYGVRTRGVDVRRSLGLSVEEDVAMTEEADVCELVEPPALEVLDPEPDMQFTEVRDVSFLPPPVRAPRRLQSLPVLNRLAMRRAAMM